MNGKTKIAQSFNEMNRFKHNFIISEDLAYWISRACLPLEGLPLFCLPPNGIDFASSGACTKCSLMCIPRIIVFMYGGQVHDELCSKSLMVMTQMPKQLVLNALNNGHLPFPVS